MLQRLENPSAASDEVKAPRERILEELLYKRAVLSAARMRKYRMTWLSKLSTFLFLLPFTTLFPLFSIPWLIKLHLAFAVLVSAILLFLLVFYLLKPRPNDNPLSSKQAVTRHFRRFGLGEPTHWQINDFISKVKRIEMSPKAKNELRESVKELQNMLDETNMEESSDRNETREFRYKVALYFAGKPRPQSWVIPIVSLILCSIAVVVILADASAENNSRLASIIASALLAGVLIVFSSPKPDPLSSDQGVRRLFERFELGTPTPSEVEKFRSEAMALRNSSIALELLEGELAHKRVTDSGSWDLDADFIPYSDLSDASWSDSSWDDGGYDSDGGDYDSDTSYDL